MTKERRKNQKLTEGDLYKHLNSRQLTALRQSAAFGWRVRCIRRPLFLEPITVLHSSRYGMIGILESDGRINMETDIETRSNKSTKSPKKEATQKENRKGMSSIPSNYEEVLNPAQLKALHRIEYFGWELHCIRRTQIEEPITIIIGPKGVKYATLEKDGRLQLISDSAIRKDSPTEKDASVPDIPVAKGS